MIVDPFWFGVLVGCLVETVLLVLWAYYIGRKK